jgi:hypothetical protein
VAELFACDAWSAELRAQSVWDSSPQLPPTPLGVSDADSERGRGLWLLRRCADDWGHYVLINGLRATGGKEVWAEWHAPYSNE